MAWGIAKLKAAASVSSPRQIPVSMFMLSLPVSSFRLPPRLASSAEFILPHPCWLWIFSQSGSYLVAKLHPFATQSYFYLFTCFLCLTFYLPAGSQLTHWCQSMHIMIEIVREFANSILINLYWSHAKWIFKMEFPFPKVWHVWMKISGSPMFLLGALEVFSPSNALTCVRDPPSLQKLLGWILESQIYFPNRKS